MNYKSKIRMSIGWIYPIGIFSSYILLFLEFELRQMLRQSGNEIWGVPYITIWLPRGFTGLIMVILTGHIWEEE
ncbi:MAG: hypothetical protein H6Q23_1199 [Bacteroidetes bacterium]|nr:hypothetical protein [Bacteroidota bacterium]